MKPNKFNKERPPYLFIAAIILVMCSACAVRHAPIDETVDRRLRSKAEYLRNTNLYSAERRLLREQHVNQRFSSPDHATMTESERLLSRWIENQVANTYSDRRGATNCAASKPFYSVKDEITKTPLFNLLCQMPKGGLLHTHISAAGRMDWILSNALAAPNCHVKWDGSDDHGKLQMGPGAGFTAVSELRTQTNFVEELRKALMLEGDDSRHSSAWKPFSDIFGKLGGYIDHPLNFTNYLVDAFETLWEDKIYVVELRDGFNSAQEEQFRKHLEDIRFARDVIRRRHGTEDFHVRIIHSGYRAADNMVTGLVQTVIQRANFPDLIAGYDLIGGEDDDVVKGATDNRVQFLLPKLVELATREQTNNVMAEKVAGGQRPRTTTNAIQELDYYLHEGESLWADNENLFDAILLNTPRIGHAFNLYRFPSLYPIIKERGIALEICPISNQLLRLTPDLRAHPAISYINAGIPCTLSSDDPAIFGNDGLSYDFWMATVAWNLDLATIKQLARNSIVHSSLDKETKETLLKFWNEQWNQFVDKSVQCLDPQPES